MEYRPYFQNATNFPEVGECPLKPKQYYFKNHVFDAMLMSKYVPLGLWQLRMMVTRNEDIMLLFDVYIKVQEKGIFY